MKINIFAVVLFFATLITTQLNNFWPFIFVAPVFFVVTILAIRKAAKSEEY